MPGTLFYGDLHGDWRPLLRACDAEPPDGVVLLGDCDLAQPLRQQLRPFFKAGIPVRWIPGNHDTDTAEWHDHLWGDYRDGNLHGRCMPVGDIMVAGLGGVFKERVWYPRFEAAVPVYVTRNDAMDGLRPADRWRGGLPLRMRDAIFMEDIVALGGVGADGRRTDIHALGWRVHLQSTWITPPLVGVNLNRCQVTTVSGHRFRLLEQDAPDLEPRLRNHLADALLGRGFTYV